MKEGIQWTKIVRNDSYTYAAFLNLCALIILA